MKKTIFIIIVCVLLCAAVAGVMSAVLKKGDEPSDDGGNVVPNDPITTDVDTYQYLNVVEEVNDNVVSFMDSYVGTGSAPLVTSVVEGWAASYYNSLESDLTGKIKYAVKCYTIPLEEKTYLYAITFDVDRYEDSSSVKDLADYLLYIYAEGKNVSDICDILKGSSASYNEIPTPQYLGWQALSFDLASYCGEPVGITSGRCDKLFAFSNEKAVWSPVDGGYYIVGTDSGWAINERAILLDGDLTYVEDGETKTYTDKARKTNVILEAGKEYRVVRCSVTTKYDESTGKKEEVITFDWLNAGDSLGAGAYVSNDDGHVGNICVDKTTTFFVCYNQNDQVWVQTMATMG